MTRLEAGLGDDLISFLRAVHTSAQLTQKKCDKTKDTAKFYDLYIEFFQLVGAMAQEQRIKASMDARSHRR